jgi:tetratricopeptide (TPR) repeat protein
MTPSQADNAAQAHQMALQGATLYQRGQTAQAREVCLAALQLAPQSCEVLLLLAFIALQANQPHESIDWINRAIAENGELADAYFLRGEAQQIAKQYEAAAASYDEVLKRKPDHADALNNRGNAWYALGQHERALKDYDKAVELNLAKASFHSNRGLAIKALGDLPLALTCFQRAIALQQDYGLAHFNLGLSLFALGRYQEAVASHDEAIRLMPGHGPSHWGQADALRATGQYEASLVSYNTAVSLEPLNADIYNNRGLLLHFWGKHHDALTDFATATRLNPQHADALCNRGMALEALGQHTDALGSYDAAIALSPRQAIAHFNRALCNLTLGNYGEGWPEYEWRWQTEQLKSSGLISDKPLWLGKESLRGKRVLVHAEQGLGDSLQFCRYLPMVSELGAADAVDQDDARRHAGRRARRGTARVRRPLPVHELAVGVRHHRRYGAIQATIRVPLCAEGAGVATAPRTEASASRRPRLGRRAAPFARGPAPRRYTQVDSPGTVRRLERARCGVLQPAERRAGGDAATGS